jgi:hypothetical protein
VAVIASSTVIMRGCSFSVGMGRPCLESAGANCMLTDCGTLASQPGSYWALGNTYYTEGAAAILASGLLCLSRTSASGSNGLRSFSSRPGMPGVSAQAEVQLAGPLSCQGGAGGESLLVQGGPGGAGVENTGALFTTDATLRGGAGGQGIPPGSPGPAVRGTVPVPAVIPILGATTLAPPGGSLTLSATSKPGSLLYLVLNTETQPVSLSGVNGVLIPRLDGIAYVEGPILVGTAGQVVWQIPIPLDQGLRGLPLFAQLAAVDIPSLPRAFLSAGIQTTVGF